MTEDNVMPLQGSSSGGIQNKENVDMYGMHIFIKNYVPLICFI